MVRARGLKYLARWSDSAGTLGHAGQRIGQIAQKDLINAAKVALAPINISSVKSLKKSHPCRAISNRWTLAAMKELLNNSVKCEIGL